MGKTPPKIAVNYPFFLFLFLSIAFLTSFPFFFFTDPLLQQNPLFFFYILLQALFEVEIFLLLAYVLKRWMPRWVYYGLITCCSLFLCIHLVDFVLIRLMDTSIMYLLKFLITPDLLHIVRVFQALNMNASMIAIIALLILCFPTVSVLLDFGFFQMVRKKPLSLSFSQVMGILGATALCLVGADLYVHSSLTPFAYKQLQKTLPLGTTLFRPHALKRSLPQPIGRPQEMIHLPSLTLKDKPNIYLFVIETLRKDFITEDIAPCLTRFGEENIQFAISSANANGTQYSWMSIFHALLPLHWDAVYPKWLQGSPYLRILKDNGYRIFVYPSTDLHYFDMDLVLFGKDRYLADKIYEFPSLEPWQKDSLCLESFEQDLKEREQGNLFIFFLDAPHSEYSFPDPGKFHPIPKQIDYLTLSKDNIEPIKNRYRNAVAYIDSLFDRFFNLLKQSELYDDACILITGDHGEEFFEEGALFHGTHLNAFQTRVPILLKFQQNPLIVTNTIATHIDLFPTLFHHLFREEIELPHCDGRSVFGKNPRETWVAFAQNGIDAPREFLLQSKRNSLHGKFVSSEICEFEVLSGSADLMTSWVFQSATESP